MEQPARHHPALCGLLVFALVWSVVLVAPPVQAAERSEVVIVGGPGAVTADLERHLSTCAGGSIERVAGIDRFATAAAIAGEWTEASTVFLATGLNYPDAIAAGPAATVSGSPVLLTRPDSLPAPTHRELERLQPDLVVLLGGPAAISPALEEGLRTRYTEVMRIGGSDRYGTAAQLSAWSFEAGVDVVYVADGSAFPDALIAGNAAARDGSPVLLVAQHYLPQATRQELARLNPDRIVVVGGEDVSASVVDQLSGYATHGVERIGGASRFETAALAVTGGAFPSVFVVTGEVFADGLSATPLADGSPIVLVGTNVLPEASARTISTALGVSCEAWSPPYPQVGTGKRILYANTLQRVWLIDENETLVDSYPVSGRADVPRPGTYTVYSKSLFTRASYGGITMEHMVRFVPPYMFGNRLAYGFHSIPRYPDGTPLQTEDELGTFLSGGCVRQADHKAEALYEWAPIGTTVVVLP
jgi:putative cell wall-binding protein